MNDQPIESPSMPKSIAAGIVKVMASVKRLAKADNNAFARYKYTSIDDFLEAVGPLCADAGIFILCQEDNCQVVEGDNSDHLTIRWAFTLGATDGALYGPIYRTVTVPAQGAQAYGSAQSYALKQFERGLFQIATGDKDDPDGNEPKPLPRGSVGKQPDPQLTPAQLNQQKLVLRALNLLQAAPGQPNRDLVTAFLTGKRWIEQGEKPEQWKSAHVPQTKTAMDALAAEIAAATEKNPIPE